MTNKDLLKIKQVQWHEASESLKYIRTEVFIKEQHVPVELEWDDNDQSCMHLLAEYDGKAVGTARLLNTGQIGRMAILKPYRAQGIGHALMEKLITMAKTMNLTTVFLNAQIDATKFYIKFGFIEHGDLFNDANIVHKRMIKKL